MASRVGLDVVEVDRVRGMTQRCGVRLLSRALTAQERRYCESRRDAAPHIAGTLAAKEAVFKVLGVPPRWQEVEVRRLSTGEPVVSLSGSLLRRAQELGLVVLQVSITHTESVAAAIVLGMGA